MDDPVCGPSGRRRHLLAGSAPQTQARRGSGAPQPAATDLRGVGPAARVSTRHTVQTSRPGGTKAGGGSQAQDPRGRVAGTDRHRQNTDPIDGGPAPVWRGRTGRHAGPARTAVFHRRTGRLGDRVGRRRGETVGPLPAEGPLDGGSRGMEIARLRPSREPFRSAGQTQRPVAMDGVRGCLLGRSNQSCRQSSALGECLAEGGGVAPDHVLWLARPPRSRRAHALPLAVVSDRTSRPRCPRPVARRQAGAGAGPDGRARARRAGVENSGGTRQRRHRPGHRRRGQPSGHAQPGAAFARPGISQWRWHRCRRLSRSAMGSRRRFRRRPGAGVRGDPPGVRDSIPAPEAAPGPAA